MAEFTHPSVAIVSDLLGDGWEPFDLLVRDLEAAVVEMRRAELRETQIIVSRNGGWVEPGLVGRDPRPVPTTRPVVTSTEEPVLRMRLAGSAWPAEDRSPPSQVWLSLDGIVAADVAAVIVATDIDRYKAAVREDGTFLALVRANWREEPRVQFQLRSGEETEVSL